jgi:DNA-binding XRE family transcriptional regulator
MRGRLDWRTTSSRILSFFPDLGLLPCCSSIYLHYASAFSISVSHLTLAIRHTMTLLQLYPTECSVGAAQEIKMVITGEKVRAARRLLGWSRSELAGHSGVSSTTIGNFETGRRKASVLDLSVVRRALEAAGIEFNADNSGAPGVRIRPSSDEAAIPPIPPKNPYDGAPV